MAAAAGAVLFFVAYIPYLFIAEDLEDLPISTKRAACLLAPTCVGIGSNILAQFETSGALWSSAERIRGEGGGANFCFQAVVDTREKFDKPLPPSPRGVRSACFCFCGWLLLGEGLNFGNLRAAPTELDSFSMADVFGMFILDTIIYLLIAW